MAFPWQADGRATNERTLLEVLFPQWLRDTNPGLGLGGRRTSHVGMLFTV